MEYLHSANDPVNLLGPSASDIDCRAFSSAGLLAELPFDFLPVQLLSHVPDI
jgi:hypothetical protein